MDAHIPETSEPDDDEDLEDSGTALEIPGIPLEERFPEVVAGPTYFDSSNVEDLRADIYRAVKLAMPQFKNFLIGAKSQRGKWSAQRVRAFQIALERVCPPFVPSEANKSPASKRLAELTVAELQEIANKGRLDREKEALRRQKLVARLKPKVVDATSADLAAPERTDVPH